VTDPKEQNKPAVRTREPKKKTPPGIFDNLRKLPQPHPVEEILGLVQVETPSTPSIGSTASTSPTPSIGSTPTRPSTPSRQGRRSPVAPERDYTKVANSIVRQAVPSGIFGEQGGKSKELYDTLYLLTRGAVVARRKVRIPKDQLMRKAGIGSEVTLRKNLTRLRMAGLINEVIVPGTHGGNEYEVFLPEEIGATGSTPPTPSRGSTASSPRQIRESVEAVEERDSSPGSSQSAATVSVKDKTLSSQTDERNDDDAALAGLYAVLKQVATEVTGKGLSPTERDRWRELGEVLATELKIAAARTTVSSAPSFLTEHLRRRLWKKDKGQLQAEIASTSTATAKPIYSAEQIAKCPDCGGSGFFYPKGYEGGVAKCKHEKLEATSAPEQASSDQA
jgi:hypothetical protein